MAKVKAAALYLLTALFILSAWALSEMSLRTAEHIPEIYEWRRVYAYEGGITFADIDAIEVQYGAKHIGASHMLPQSTVKGSSRASAITLVNGVYFDAFKRTLVAGSGITQAMVDNASNYAVISTALAQTLFQTTQDVIGRMVFLQTYTFDGDIRYDTPLAFRVAGLYSAADNLWQSLAQDVYDRVFIPYTAMNGSDAVYVDTLHYGKENSILHAALYMNTSTAFSSLRNHYFPIDHQQARESAQNPAKLMSQLVLLTGILFCLMNLFSIVKACIWRVRKTDKNTDAAFISLLHMDSAWFLHQGALLLVLLVSVIFLLLIPSQSIYINLDRIASDNFYDVSFYLKRFLSDTQLYNTRMQSAGDLSMLRLAKQSMQYGFVLLLVFLLLYISSKTLFTQVCNNSRHDAKTYLFWLMATLFAVIWLAQAAVLPLGVFVLMCSIQLARTPHTHHCSV